VIFKALACDFDGTLASEDRIGDAARAALRQAREAGSRLILVTGRTFFELTRVCECLELFDAVVAENGGVLYFPRDAMIRDQGPAPPTRLLAELDRRGIYYQVGRVIVGTTRADEPGVREALNASGVSRDLVYNRGHLMLLPAGMSKGTGVERVLRSLGLSFQDVLALGDAENDLPFFEACGWGACPANGVPALKERADWVFPGENGDGVAAAITGPIIHGLLSGRHSPRHRVAVGWVAETSEPVAIPARDVNVLIHGDPLSGKSWLAGALVERLSAARYGVFVIDPEGDYRVLVRLPGVTGVEISGRASLDQAFAQFDRSPEACVVADLSTLSHERKIELIQAALERIGDSRRRNGLPHWVVLDEAHYSLHREGVADEVLRLDDKGFCLHVPAELAQGLGREGPRCLHAGAHHGGRGTAIPACPPRAAGGRGASARHAARSARGRVRPDRTRWRRDRADLRGGPARDGPCPASLEVRGVASARCRGFHLPRRRQPRGRQGGQPPRLPARRGRGRRRGAGPARRARRLLALGARCLLRPGAREAAQEDGGPLAPG